jgi:hypothetical protein
MVFGFIGVLVTMTGLFIWTYRTEQVRRTFESPDGRYRIVLSSSGPLWEPFTPHMPGGGSDFPGVVRLYDKSGKLLHSADVELLIQADRVDWEPRSVSIPLVADWELPTEK